MTPEVTSEPMARSSAPEDQYSDLWTTISQFPGRAAQISLGARATCGHPHGVRPVRGIGVEVDVPLGDSTEATNTHTPTLHVHALCAFRHIDQ